MTSVQFICVNHCIFILVTSQLQAFLVLCPTMARYCIAQHIFHVSNEVRHNISRSNVSTHNTENWVLVLKTAPNEQIICSALCPSHPPPPRHVHIYVWGNLK
jgi:hypothetical protein